MRRAGIGRPREQTVVRLVPLEQRYNFGAGQGLEVTVVGHVDCQSGERAADGVDVCGDRRTGADDLGRLESFGAVDVSELDKCDRVTIDSVRNHCGRHFPVQNVAKATYRAILERRAKANGVDFVEGVATAITPIAFFETVMLKSYETLVDSNTKVDVNTGIVAARRLQSLIDSRDYSHDLLVMRVQMDQICDAVKSTVPQEMWGEIIEKLEEFEQHQEALSVGTDSFDDDDEPFDPTEFIDEDDEF